MKIGLSCFAAVAVIVLWFLWPQKAALSESEYDVAIALYRVCNQSSEAGLAKIEILMAEHNAANSSGEDSPLSPIIITAKAGKWQAAAKACRIVLDEQIVLRARTESE